MADQPQEFVDVMVPSFRAPAYVAIEGERDYQDKKWGDSAAATPAEMLLAIDDYVGEAKRFWSRNERPQCDEFVLNAMRKIAAMAVAVMEKHGVRYREAEGPRPVGYSE